MPVRPASDVVALVDCASFYCSCERVFDPSLAKVPVAVLSNNDGCVIARTDEVKALGIPMGAPYFKYRATLERHGVRVFSSNYALYADLSHRVMEVLRTFSPEVEVYSIDEAFLHLRRQPAAAMARTARAIRRKVLRWTGIPVRVGIGPTKTLAKIAMVHAKRHPAQVFSLVDRPDVDALLEAVPVGDVWGVGRSYGRRLPEHGVHTALDLRDVPDDWARRHLTVVGLRTVWELRGTPCLPLDLLPPTRKGFIRSRSFGQAVTTLDGLREAVATRTSRAAEKLRQYGLDATALQVFITTKHYTKGPQYSNAVGVTLPRATSYTPELIQAALTCLDRIYRPGYAYKKAGVLCTDLVPHHPEQGHLFLRRDPRHDALMAAVDRINGRFGRQAVFVARCGIRRPWAMHQTRRSPCYTTRWSDLPVARAA